MGETVETIEDPAELAQVRRQARQVQIKSLITAIVLTAIVLVLPET